MIDTADERLKDVLLPSEIIEPLFAKTLGQLFAQWEQSKKNRTAARKFYQGVLFVSKLAIINGAPHASIAMSNTVSRVERLLEGELKIDRLPKKWWEDRL